VATYLFPDPVVETKASKEGQQPKHEVRPRALVTPPRWRLGLSCTGIGQAGREPYPVLPECVTATITARSGLQRERAGQRTTGPLFEVLRSV
jgi:hypothetical protein